MAGPTVREALQLRQEIERALKNITFAGDGCEQAINHIWAAGAAHIALVRAMPLGHVEVVVIDPDRVTIREQ